MELFYREMSFGDLPSLEQMIKFCHDAWTEQGLQNSISDPGIVKFGGFDGGVVMASQYYDTYVASDHKNWKIIAAEGGFGLKDEVMIGEDDKVVVYYVGKPDLFIYEYASDKVIMLDHKTVAYIDRNIHTKYKPHPQTTGYIYAANILAKQLGYDNVSTDRCIINCCARTEPTDKPRDGVKKPRFLRVYPSYSQAEIEEWRQSIMQKCHRLLNSLVEDQWPMTGAPFTCHVYGGCSYRRVCSVPPGSRDIILNADFVQIDPWKAYEVESDTEEE